MPADTGPLALLVDGDNVPPEMLGALLAHLQRRAPVTERCIFRNWRSTRDSKNWDEAAKRLAFERIDRYKTTEGKNGSDIAVAVAAMDFLHKGVRNFCIASGDTDFAPLVERLRRAGSWVSIVGHKMDGGLLSEIADDYVDWKSLLPKGQTRSASTTRSTAQPARAAPSTRGRAQVRGKPPVTPPAQQDPRPASSPSAPAGRDATGQLARKGARPQRRVAPPKPAPKAPEHGVRPAPRPRNAAPVLPPRAASEPGSEALRSLLVDCYEVARTDGDVDSQGWVAVDRLGQIARSLDPGFKPARYGLGSRTPFSRAFERFPNLFAIEAVGRQGNRQYRVRLK